MRVALCGSPFVPAKSPCQERPLWMPKLLNSGYLRKQPGSPSACHCFPHLGPARLRGQMPCPPHHINRHEGQEASSVRRTGRTTLCENMGFRETLLTHKACVSGGEVLDPMYLGSSPGVLTGSGAPCSPNYMERHQT